MSEAAEFVEVCGVRARVARSLFARSRYDAASSFAPTSRATPAVASSARTRSICSKLVTPP